MTHTANVTPALQVCIRTPADLLDGQISAMPERPTWAECWLHGTAELRSITRTGPNFAQLHSIGGRDLGMVQVDDPAIVVVTIGEHTFPPVPGDAA